MLRNVAATADAYTNLASRIRLVTDSQAQANAVLQQVFDIAQQTRGPLQATGNLYVTLARATADLGVSQAQLAQITATVNQAFAVSGASAESARNAIVQLSQGLASGALRGDEFNSVAEQAPILMDLLSKSLGKSRGELREFAAQGGITSKILIGALLSGAQDVGSQFAQMTPTIAQAGQTLANAAARFVGAASNMSGAAAAVSGTISALARNFDAVANVALVAGAAVGARMAVQLGVATQAWVSNTLAVASAPTPPPPQPSP